MSKATKERKTAEMAKRKSDEIVNREMALKKECELEIKEAQRQMTSDTEREEAAKVKVDQLLAVAKVAQADGPPSPGHCPVPGSQGRGDADHLALVDLRPVAVPR